MSSDSTYAALQSLATFAAETTLADIPTDVIDRAHWVLRDTVGVMLGGLQVPEVARLADYAAEHHAGAAQLLGTRYTMRPEWAALIYGTAGTTLEFDEGHAFARGHAAVHAVGAVLALAATQDVSGEDLLTAMIIGYEVAARIGVAATLRADVHPFGAWGVVGAAAIAAKLADFSADDMLSVFDLAASYAITPSYHTAFQGANVRNTYAGMANHNGLLAFEMFKLGFRGEKGGVATAFGKILGEDFDVSALTEDLGERYEMMRGYFKPYSACRYSHATVDAILNIDEAIAVQDIHKIDIDTYDFAAQLNDPRPKTPLAARFSIPYIAAATLVDGGAGVDSFTDDAIQREDVLQLAGRISIRESADYTTMLPHKRAAKITIHSGDKTITSEAIGSKGDPDQPMGEDELLDKFNSLTAAYPSEYRDSLWEKMGRIVKMESLENFFRLQRVDI